MLKLVSVTKSYPTKQGRHFILNKTNFEIKKGEKIGILGKNGSGKTTLVRILAGVIPPDEGRVIRDMKVSWPVGYNGGFNTDLTGTDNIRFIANIYNQRFGILFRYVQNFSEIGDFINEPMKTYSTGMRAKLNFGLMLGIDFDCYLIDELLNVGDISFRQKCNRELFIKRKDRSIVIVSHNDKLIQQYCDKAMVFHNQQIFDFNNTKEAIKFYHDSIKP